MDRRVPQRRAELNDRPRPLRHRQHVQQPPDLCRDCQRRVAVGVGSLAGRRSCARARALAPRRGPSPARLLNRPARGGVRVRRRRRGREASSSWVAFSRGLENRRIPSYAFVGWPACGKRSSPSRWRSPAGFRWRLPAQQTPRCIPDLDQSRARPSCTKRPPRRPSSPTPDLGRRRRSWSPARPRTGPASSSTRTTCMTTTARASCPTRPIRGRRARATCSPSPTARTPIPPARATTTTPPTSSSSVPSRSRTRPRSA